MAADELANKIEHTALKPDETTTGIIRLCQEAREYGFLSVCINPVNVARAVLELEGTGILVCSVIAFPFGAEPGRVKAYQAAAAVEDGARSLDMVMNIGALKSGEVLTVEQDIGVVVRAGAGTPVKVILETGYLTEEEIALACAAAEQAGAAFVKTSTGFGPGGATVEHVRLMRRLVGDRLGVKAAGGIRSAQAAVQMLEAGANLLGCSAGPAILRELRGR
ncbi:MAG: deoxyribose-phosphate aldolase [Chloroflexota bacterium]|nr:MAG: deoxyribose-phosphate aldolase [Chloroflexota bacterium]